MADADYERVLLVKNEVFVYRIPPRTSNRGYRAADWKLDEPDWTGRLQVTAKGNDLVIKLEDKNTGDLFAKCPVESWPTAAVESVLDSSRYFVIMIKDDHDRKAFIGIGFQDRADSFDLNVSIQDHFKWLKQEAEAEKSAQTLSDGPKLDLGFKEGQTITLNIGSIREGAAKSRPKPKSGGTIGLLPPPPGGVKLPPPGGAPAQPRSEPAAMQPPQTANPTATSNVDILFDVDASNTVPAQPLQPTQKNPPPDLWGDFTSAESTTNQNNSNANRLGSGGDWVQF